MHPIDTCLALRGLKAKVKIAEILDNALNYYRSKNKTNRTITSTLMEMHQSVCYPTFEYLMQIDYDQLIFVSRRDMPLFYQKTMSVKVNKIGQTVAYADIVRETRVK